MNGLKVLCMRLGGTLPVSESGSGVAFLYYNCDYAGTEGVVQLVTYAGSNLFSQCKTDFEAFLNGLGRVTP